MSLHGTQEQDDECEAKLETVLNEGTKPELNKWNKETIKLQRMKIFLLQQEVRGLKAMLNQYKRDYKKLLEKEV